MRGVDWIFFLTVHCRIMSMLCSLSGSLAQVNSLRSPSKTVVDDDGIMKVLMQLAVSDDVEISEIAVRALMGLRNRVLGYELPDGINDVSKYDVDGLETASEGKGALRSSE